MGLQSTGIDYFVDGGQGRGSNISIHAEKIAFRQETGQLCGGTRSPKVGRCGESIGGVSARVLQCAAMIDHR